MLRHLTIAKKGLLVLLLPLVYQALLLGTLLKRQRDQREAQESVVHTRDILEEIGRVDHSVLTMQGAFRAYAITDKPEFARECEEAIAAAPRQLQSLQTLTRDSSPEQRARVARIAQIAGERIAWQQAGLGEVREGGSAAGLERVRSLEGKRLMDALQQEISAFERVAEELDLARLAELGKTTERQNRLLIGGLVLNVVIGLGAALLFSLSISRRVERLAANAGRLARGQQLARGRAGYDELGQLDRSFHTMADDLASARERERSAQLALERRNAELEHVNRDLDHKNEENEMFVYSVSHDLRSPLVNLQGFSKELGLARDDLRVLFEKEWTDPVRQRARKVVDRDVTESIHYIQTAVMRLSTIIDALLRLSRAGRVDYQPEMVDLQAVVQRVAIALRGSLAERAAELSIGQLPPVWADPTAIEQVFANLLANAVNYLDPARPGRIEVGFCDEPPAESGGMATWFVKDNGLGIAEAWLPKVFAIFQRLHAHAAKGEGVGLTLVRRMVERHGGLIWVKSVVGEGSVFYVALPGREVSPLQIAPRKESVKLAQPTPGPTS